MAGLPPPPPPPPPPPQGANVTIENGGQNPTINSSNKAVVLLNVINTISHILLGMVGVGAIVFANVLESSFLTQHIYLCVIGYIMLLSLAVLSLSPHTNWTNNLEFHQKKLIHWIMQIIGSSTAIAGSIIMIVNNDNNFQTTHGILGLIAMILTMLSLVGGVVNLFCSKQLTIKLIHSLIGAFTIIFAYIALCFGFHDFYRFFMGDTNTNLFIGLAVFALIGTLVSVFINMFKRLGF